MACLPATMRVVLLVGIVLAGCLHICVIAFPNWWWFNYGYWVQDTTGVLGTNGGIFQYCQHYRIMIGGHYNCFNYGDKAAQSEGLLDTTEDLMPLGGILTTVQAFTVLALFMSLPIIVLIGVACKVGKKQTMMRIVSLCLLLQCGFMIGSVGSAHQWIHQPLCMECDWRDLYNYDWAFYAAGALIGIYMCLFVLAFITSCTDTNEPLEDRFKARTHRADTRKQKTPAGYHLDGV
ncbi:uncharacterized protein LOC135806060 [Sycon ciliatum]|uniref:uncharacterized protein LOC135806060 n=1 Tax=Sycon ciliatum TaxID=27933 RepID=UPI0020AB7AD2|eukprot:scpid95427/ scgid24280/ 